MREARLDKLHGFSIVERKFEAGLLTLVPEKGEAMTIVCVCGRHHFIATTLEVVDQMVLKVVCHNCGRHAELPYSGGLYTHSE